MCPEVDRLENVCGGLIAVEQVDDWLHFRCGACGVERVQHIQTADPAQKRQLRLEQASLPLRFLGLKFEEDETNRSTLSALRSWIADYRKGERLPAPALYGHAGRGKSHLLTAVCTRLVRECDASVWFRPTRSLLRDLQDFDGDAERAWKRAVTVDVLALDDFGAQQVTDWRHDQIADLVDGRYERELPVVLATNFAPKAWRDATDERTASRLRGMTFALELGGPDRRQIQMHQEPQSRG